jgi:hypothetical protein
VTERRTRLLGSFAMAVCAILVGLLLLAVLLPGCSPGYGQGPQVIPLPPPPTTSTAGNGLSVVAYTTPPTITGAYPARCAVRIVADRQLPDRGCTPGSVAVAADQQAATICRAGWTETVRPSATITASVKTAAMRAYGIPSSARDRVEFDHLVPLTLGGSNDVTNLWPQLSDLPGRGFLNTKDAVESALGRAVCTGRVELGAAQRAIAADWTTARALLRDP